jgi:hypothetical protein
MEPTLQFCVLIGKPIFAASNTVNAAPSSVVNPLECEAKWGNHNCFYLSFLHGGLRFGETSDSHNGAVDEEIVLARDVVSLNECFLIFRRITAVLEGSEDDGIVVLWNIRNCSWNDTASHAGTLESSAAPLRGLEVELKELQLPSASLNTRRDTCRYYRTHAYVEDVMVVRSSSYGLHDSLNPHPQPDSDANAPIKRKVQRRLWLLVHRSFSVYHPYCCHWTNSIAGTRSRGCCNQYYYKYVYYFWL